MSLPAIIIIVYYGLILGLYLAKNGKTETTTYSFKTALIAVVTHFAILYWGGFFN